MLVLVSRYCREPQDFVYFTTKNKGSNCSYAIKQAKRFKSVEAIDKHFDSLVVPEEIKEVKIWRNNWTTRDVNNVTALNPITEFKPVGNFVLVSDYGFYCESVYSKFVESDEFSIYEEIGEGHRLSTNLLDAKIFSTTIGIERLLDTFEIKHCFVGVNGLVLSRSSTLPNFEQNRNELIEINSFDLELNLDCTKHLLEPKSTDVVLGGNVQPKNTDVVLSPSN